MTEYSKAYNWEETWLNAPPLQRSKGRQSPEPRFQHKRHFERSDSFNLWGLENQAEGTSEDPYFIIHGRKHKEFAYPNILYRRSKSVPRENHNPPLLKNVEYVPQRPKSDGVTEVKIATKGESSKNRSRSRSLSKDKKKPIERWPELKMDIPSDSPRQKPTKPSEHQRSFSPSLVEAHKRDRPLSPKLKAEKTKPKQHSTPGEKKAKLKLDDRVSRRSEFDTMSRASPSDSVNLKPELKQRKLQSEYQANYRDLSDFANVAKILNDEARQNQLQVEGSHFSLTHFNQLDSANVTLWDPLYSSRSEIVRIAPTQMTKRLNEFKAPAPLRRADMTFSNRGFRVPRTLKSSFKLSSPALAAPYEPSRYLESLSGDDEQRVKILPYEEANGLGCTPSHHYCNRGRSFLVSKVRPGEISASSANSPVRHIQPIPPDPLSPSLSLAESTLDRASRRVNKLLISTCRS